MSATTKSSASDAFDVIVVGGGSAGIGAVIGASQAAPGARILLVESESCLGGAGIHRGVYSLCGLYTCTEQSRRCVGAIWDELRKRLLEIGATNESPVRHRGVFQVFDPEGMKLVLDQLMSDLDIEVLLHSLVVSATRSSAGVLTSITVQSRSRTHTYTAKSFVDCSGDGDLAFHGGASVRYGNHGTVNLGSLGTRFGGLRNAHPSAEKWQEAILAAKRDDPSLYKKIPKNSSVLIRLPCGDITTYLVSAIYDATDGGSISKAEKRGRQEALEYLKILRRLPGHENMYLVSTGPNFGTRESRHINARYQLKYEDVVGGRHFDDAVALCGWGMEWHDEMKEDWSSTFELAPSGLFEIPFGCLCSNDTENLFVAGRCLDGDQKAGSAARVMGTALATGQAAGVGAALTAMNGVLATAADVQRVLRENGAFLDPEKLPQPVNVLRAT